MQVSNNYETDLIYPIIQKVSELAKVSYSQANDKLNFKIVGDHLRAIVYLISDGVVPSNTKRGYVLRLLIRRAVRAGRSLGLKGDCQGNLGGAFLPAIAGKVIEMSTYINPDVKDKAPGILKVLKREELVFMKTLGKGEKKLHQMLDEALLSAEKSGSLPLLVWQRCISFERYVWIPP